MTPRELAFEHIKQSLEILDIRIQNAITSHMNMAEVFTVRLDMTNITTFIKHQIKTLKEIEP